MLIKKLTELPSFTAGDETLLKEVLNPAEPNANVRYSLAHAVVQPGNTTLKHRLKSSEVYYILKGEGLMTIDHETEKVYPNQLVYIPPMALQCIENTGQTDLEFLCICDPAWKKEDETLDSKYKCRLASF